MSYAPGRRHRSQRGASLGLPPNFFARGWELARQPEEVRLGDLIEALEGDMHLLECVDVENVCVLESFCKLKGALAEAERVQIDYLNGITLQDVTPTRRQLNRLALA